MHQNLTYSDLGFKKISRGRNPRTPLLTGPLRGGEGLEREGEGKGREREGTGEGMWRGPKSGLPRGPRWLSAGLLSGNTLASTNVVALRQTRLVLGWVTVCRRVNHLGM